MNDWSLASEYFALILLAVILLFFYDTRAVRGFGRRRRYYWASLLFSGISILLNIAAVFVIENIRPSTISLAITLNTLYFFTSWLMITFMVYFLFLRVMEFVYNEKALRIVKWSLAGIFLLYTALLIYNLFSGIIFSFDANGLYLRGPLNAIGFLMPLTEVAMLLVCFWHFRKSVGSPTKKILFVASPIAVLLLFYQVLYPDQLLNGAICTLVNLIIFISYRGGRAEQDYLTGLDNQRCLMTELTHRTGARQPYQVILVKIRNLSAVTRAYGQGGGNAILFQVADFLQKLAGEDLAFRYSTDEFALLFSDADGMHCEERRRQVARQLKRTWEFGSYEVALSFSVLDLRYQGQAWTIEDICGYLTDASHKVTSEDIDVFPFDEGLIHRHQRKLFLIHSMHTALREHRFEVWYQPVYYHNSEKFESAEALLRMFDEHGEAISPSEFIPVAEETGLIDELTAFVLESSCRLLRFSGIKDLKTVSVNLPIRQICEEGLKERFRAILAEYEISPEQIKLEITERDVVENGLAAVEAIKGLTNDGYRFMLDDFGIGYSNLARVLSLPLDSIKLDRSIVLQLEASKRDQNIIKEYLVPLIRQLGQMIVAEGVETKELAGLVLDCKVNRIQGFYYARPMPESALIEWYKKHETAPAESEK